MTELNPQPAQPSDEFTQHVKHFLENLHDFGYLQNYPLKIAFGSTSKTQKEAPWEQIRREILLAIETISPAPNTPISSPRARSYQILNLHYLEEIPLQQCAQELGISLRQTNRELRRAEQSIAAILWSKFGDRMKESQFRPVVESFQPDPEQIRLNFETVDMAKLLQEASKEIVLLAQEHNVHYHLILPDNSVSTLTDKMIARQIFIAVISRLIQVTHPGDMHISFYSENESQELQIRFYPSTDAAFPPMESFLQNLLNRMEWKLAYQQGSPTVCRVIFETITPPTLLVIDDNEGLGLLLERYLSGRRCRVVNAHNGADGLTLACKVDPDAILLDVMMPEMDGWQVLNRLKNNELTREIPVIVCSVFNDPRLARSLGAAQFLPKPLNRDDFLAAIQKLGL
jgi:CheY-like chemotaxis protein